MLRTKYRMNGDYYNIPGQPSEASMSQKYFFHCSKESKLPKFNVMQEIYILASKILAC